MANKTNTTNTQNTQNEADKVMESMTSQGWILKENCEAQLANHFPELFNDRFYMKGNAKTGVIPVFNLPNIKLQADFLRLVKNNKEKIYSLVPQEHREQFDTFVEYMKNNRMCYNCQSCMRKCYNNNPYDRLPQKAMCDLRQLYRIVEKPMVVMGEILQHTLNAKYVRLNGSGEIHNELIFDLYKRIAKANPDTIYFTYTKNFDLIAGRKIPKNLVINLSDFGTSEKIDQVKHLLSKNLNTYKSISEEEIKRIKEDKVESKHICYNNCSSCQLCAKKKGITIYCGIHGTYKNR